MLAAQSHVADEGRQGGGHKGHIDVLTKGLPPAPGIGPGAQDDGPDVDNVLAEEGKAGHQADEGNGEAVEGVLAEIEDDGADQSHQGGVDQGGPRSGDLDIVGDEHILHRDDFDQSRQDVGRMVQNHRRQQLSSDEQQDEFIHFLVSHGAGLPSYLWDARVRRLFIAP